MNSIKNLIKELEHLEKMHSDNKEKGNDKALDNKINFWTDLIKSDLSGTEKEILSRIEKNETKFIKEIDNKQTNKNNTAHKITSTSPNLVAKKHLNRSQKRIKLINNLDIEDNFINIIINNKNNDYNFNNIYNNLNRIIINKSVNSGLLYSQNSEKHNISVTERNKLKTQNKNSPKSVFSKFSFLKQKPNTTESKSIKIPNSNNHEQNLIEDIKENIIEKDYNDTTDEDYRQLLEKKSQYLQTGARLEENIKKVQKTLNKKYSSISDIVQENLNKLDLLKSRNELLEKEINNLHKVYQLILEKEKLKYELKQKEKEIKTEKEKERENKTLKDINNSSKIDKDLVNGNKEIFIQKKNKRKSGYLENNEKKEQNVNNETREEKLNKLKMKYKDLKEDEPIEESEAFSIGE